MNEVSVQVIRMIALAVARCQAVDPHEILSGFPEISVETGSKRKFVSWNGFAQWLQHLDSSYVNLDWKQVGQMLVDRQTNPVLIQMTRMTMSMRSAYWLASHWFGPSHFPIIENRFEDLAANKIRQTLFVDPSHSACPQVFEIFAGSQIAAPRVSFGLPEAVVDCEISGHKGIYEVTFPESHSLWFRLRNMILNVFHWRSLLKELATQQKAIHEQSQTLAAERSEFRNLIEKFPDGVLIHRQGIIQYLNPKIAEFLHLSDLSSWVGRPVADLIHPQDLAVVRERIQLGDQRYYKTFEVSLLRAGSAELFSAEYTPLPIYFEGGPAVALVVRDLTERKKLQSHLMLDDRMRSLGQLAAGVGHEINNPLFLAQLKVRQLQDNLQSEKDSASLEMIREIQQGLVRIEGIVKQLKAFARGQDDQTPAPVSVSKAVHSALQMARNIIQSRAQLVIDEEPLPPVLANEAHLGQIFLNLLINAAQAIPLGAPDRHQISISMTQKEGHVSIEIRDTGSGIPENVRPHLFQPFYTTKAKTEGTGLGLSISQSLVSRYHGTIEYDSIVDEGTVFRVTFPAFQSETVAQPEIPQKTEPEARSCGRILILDDEEDLLNALEGLVGNHHEVVALSDGRTALERIENGEEFDCILCDLMMPHLDGEQFYRRLQTSHPKLVSKFIFLTGGTFSTRHDEFINQPGIRHQEKPIEVDRLLDLIDSTMMESGLGLH